MDAEILLELLIDRHFLILIGERYKVLLVLEVLSLSLQLFLLLVPELVEALVRDLLIFACLVG